MNQSSFPLSEYAAKRPWCVSSGQSFQAQPTLAGAWQHSAAVFARVAQALDEFDPDAHGVLTLAAAGSLGRMEALAHSDCDLIVILHDDYDRNADVVGQIMQAIWTRLEALDLRLPKSWGIFVEPASVADLTRKDALGDLNDSRAIFGKRLQCLLDSQPLFRPRQFEQLQRQILEWYATAFVNEHADKPWTYLLNDLVRYYRSYAAWQQFELKVEHDDSWYIRNAKLRSSRLTMYAGLLFLLGEASRQQADDKIGWLLDRLKLTPLERLVWVMDRYPGQDRSITRLLECYEVFLAAMNDAGTRQALIDEAPRTLADLPPEKILAYSPIHESSAEIMDILTRFVLARDNDWSRRFMRYLLF
ncbi:MAG: DUF294 nucleotidyltransferase-like domain-containing protein [Nitrosospira sp.]|nr:DUF294 nucleotidyltransferase-like domain-containing protein [Nitrosospira sp.]